jgi:heterodisulfide reductase subunit A
MITTKNKKIGSVLVVGGGVAGMQASLDLATSGYKVFLVDKAPAIGGIMAQLDKTFPTNDCNMCLIAPNKEEGAGCLRFGLAMDRHPNIDVLVDTELESLSGEAGNFQAVLNIRPRFIDPDRCTACGDCARVCPVNAVDEFNAGLDRHPAVYMTFPMAVPRVFTIAPQTCNNCGQCVEVCPAQAVDLADEPLPKEIDVGAVVLAMGNDTFDPSQLLPYYYGVHSNVITSLEFERLFSGTGPSQGKLLRPSDQTEPQKIAWLQCIGSRDLKTHSYCSDVCCMYAIKEAVLAKDRIQHDLDTAIFFMDMRTCGKEYEQYYQRAKLEQGVRFIRYRVPELAPEGDDIRIFYPDATGEMQSEVFNLVVLSVGFEVSPEARKVAERLGIELNRHNFAQTSPALPVATSKPGIYVCGTFQAPKDIPHAVMDASAAVASCSALLSEVRWTQTGTKELPVETIDAGGKIRVGVFVCSCGNHLAQVVDVKAVQDYAATLPQVVYVEDNSFACFPDGLDRITDIVKANKINRVVVAGCSPLTHEHLFQKAVKNAGLNQYFCEMANIREQVAWVHLEDKDRATQKAKDLLRQAVARVSVAKPIKARPWSMEQKALVVGGGVAGMTAALNLAQQGFGVHLIERQGYLGGLAHRLHRTIEGMDVDAYLHDLINQVANHNNIDLLLETEITRHQGYKGNFVTTVAVGSGKSERRLNHGVVVIATGAQEYRPTEFLYGQDKRVMTQLELGDLLQRQPAAVAGMERVVMLQCIGSRNANNPNCSRICCQSAVKHALQLKGIAPDLDIIILYRDLRMFGLLEDYYIEARDKGVLFVRFDLEQQPQISQVGGVLKVTFLDNVLQRPIQVAADAIVLSTATVAAPNKNLSDLLKVERNSSGFFTESHAKLRPVDSATEGIYLGGMAHSPQLISESIAQALAAAARAGALLADRTQTSSPIVAGVDSNGCVACLACVRTCPYGAPFINKERKSEINAALCKGCGVCAAVCPAKAIQLAGYEDEQVMAEIRAL